MNHDLNHSTRKQVKTVATDLIKVLTVDDNKDLALIINRLFEQYADIIPAGVAGNGLEAIDLMKKSKVDVVLLDIIMPQMDGMQFLEHLAKIKGDRPGVIVLSAIGGNTLIRRALELGADGFLIKPVEASTMIEMIRSVHKARHCKGLTKVDIR